MRILFLFSAVHRHLEPYKWRVKEESGEGRLYMLYWKGK